MGSPLATICGAGPFAEDETGPLAKTIAHDLARLALKPGDVIAAIGGNAPEVWALFRAATSRGLVLALLNDSWSPGLLGKLVTKLGAQCVIGYGTRQLRPAAADLVEGRLTETGLECGTRRARPRTNSHLAESTEGAIVFSTSGSTGEPKCVVSAPRNYRFANATIGAYLGLRAGQCIIDALPPSFDYGFYQGLLAREFGLRMTFVSSPQMTGDLLRHLRSVRRVVLPLTPSVAARLCAAMREGEAFPGVEVVSLTGGGVSAGLRQRLAAAFPEARIFAMYGLTECKRVAYLDPALFLEKPHSCGKEMPGVTGRIVDETGTPVAQGESGELTIEGENVCLGYWGDPQATARRFRRKADGDVVLHTGDRFRRDADGSLEFLGRSDAQVKLRDERVSLSAIESELRASPLLLDVALEIDADADGIAQLTALAVPISEAATEQDIQRSFRDCVSKAGHLPHRVVITRELPVNHNGKRLSVIAQDGTRAATREAPPI